MDTLYVWKFVDTSPNECIQLLSVAHAATAADTDVQMHKNTACLVTVEKYFKYN